MTSPGRPASDGSPERRTGGGDAGPIAPPDPDGGPGRDSGGKRIYAPDFLTELFRNPLDPGYADAAARRAAGQGRTGARRRAAGAFTAVTTAAIGFLLVVGYQQTIADEPARTKARQELAEQVQQRREETGRLQRQADRLADEVAALRERELGEASAGQRDLAAVAGLARVRGDGARVVLGDGPESVDAVTGRRRTEGRVKDSDLQLAANALWAAGAEAIAINGQRLTATSTIRQAGEAILVDLRPVSSPYQVVAIGPDKLADEFRDGNTGRLFKTLAARFGMSFEVAEVESVTLEPAAEVKLRVAVPSTPPPASPGAESPSSPDGTRPAPSGSPSEGGR